jgi:hypothetical protein
LARRPEFFHATTVSIQVIHSRCKFLHISFVRSHLGQRLCLGWVEKLGCERYVKLEEIVEEANTGPDSSQVSNDYTAKWIGEP